MIKKIRVLLIFEILGRPPEHIKKSLEDFVDTLGNQKGVELVSKTIHEPKPVEEKDAKDLFTTFAEAEVILDNTNLLFSIVLNMLPSTIEIIQPEELKLSNFELNSVLSELTVKLHKYDEVVKAISLENNNLVNQLKSMEQTASKTIPQNITFTIDPDSPKTKNNKTAKERKTKTNKNSTKKKK